MSSDKRLCFPASSSICSFHLVANSLLFGHVKTDQSVLMHLCANCVPISTYGCAVKDYSAADMLRCHVAVNNAIRKIFSFAVWQSIRHIRISHGFLSVYELFQNARCKFLSSASCSSNVVISQLSSLTVS